MKHIKYFESKSKPKIGDYVICQEEDVFDSDPETRRKDLLFDQFIRSHVGKIVDIDVHIHYVQYKNIPKEIKDYFKFIAPKNKSLKNLRQIEPEEIIYYSPYKDKLEQIIINNKFNI